MDRLPLLKALADDSRYAIFSELGRSADALTTTEIAERLDLHPNTVRLHLERLRDVGLVEASTRGHGAVGRPQHHWALTVAAPSLGLEPSGWRVLAHLLAEVAGTGAAGDEQLRAVGREAGASRARGREGSTPSEPGAPGSSRQRVVDELTDLGFSPAVERVSSDPAGAEVTAISFTRCPFREVATAFPDLVCALHHGVTQGIADVAGAGAAAVTAFSSLVDADPCRAELTVTAPAG